MTNNLEIKDHNKEIVVGTNNNIDSSSAPVRELERLISNLDKAQEVNTIEVTNNGTELEYEILFVTGSWIGTIVDIVGVKTISSASQNLTKVDAMQPITDFVLFTSGPGLVGLNWNKIEATFL